MAQGHDKGIIRKHLIAGVAGFAVLTGGIAGAAPAEARNHRRGGDDTVEKVLIGAAGVAAGYALAQAGNGRSQQDPYYQVQYREQQQYRQRGNGGPVISGDYSGYSWANDQNYVAQAEQTRIAWQGRLDQYRIQYQAEMQRCNNINANAAARGLQNGKLFDWRANIGAGNAFQQCAQSANSRYQMRVQQVDSQVQNEFQRLETRFTAAATRNGGARYSSPAQTQQSAVGRARDAACAQVEAQSIRTGKPPNAYQRQKCGL